MNSNVSEHLQSMFAKMENFISTKTVVGEPVHFGDIIVIPLVEVSFAVGSGIGEGKSDAGGGGGGMLGSRLIPVAVVVIVNGTVQLVNVKNQESVNKLIDMIPGLISKFNFEGLFSKKSKDSSDGKSEAGGAL